MSEQVRRYDYGYVDDGNGSRYLGLIERDTGKLVRHDDYAALRAEAEALRAQRNKMAQILRDLVPGCKWRIMRPRIDQALQEVDGGY